MITILGALLGFITSVAPEMFGFFKAKQDNAQELAILQLQIQQQAAGATQQLAEINAQADIAESAALNDRVKPIGIKWVDALSSSVRPIITYLFFFSYITVKAAQYTALAHPEILPWMTAAQQTQQWHTIVLSLWSDEDQGLFAAIMSFWFGARHMDKVRQGA